VVKIALEFVCSIVAFAEKSEFPVKCMGFGFIKDFDIENQTFYVICPLKEEVLENTHVIYRSKEIDFSK